MRDEGRGLREEGKRGFTLIELLTVIGIMGLLGTVSVGGYRAMRRGMEERSVMQNVNTLVKAAYERAQIDRQPTAVFFWNETIRGADDDPDGNEIVVGHAVAVRRNGRISRKDGNYLVDEFGDLDKTFPMAEGAEEGEEGDLGANGENGASDSENTFYLYQLDDLGGKNLELKRSIVAGRVADRSRNEIYLQRGFAGNGANDDGEIEAWAFQIEDANGVDWKTGSAYGMEFAEITLPRNYIFGANYSKNLSQPIVELGNPIICSVGRNSGSGSQGGVTGSIQVYSLRPDGSGGLKAEKVGTNDNPY